MWRSFYHHVCVCPGYFLRSTINHKECATNHGLEWPQSIDTEDKLLRSCEGDAPDPTPSQDHVPEESVSNNEVLPFAARSTAEKIMWLYEEAEKAKKEQEELKSDFAGLKWMLQDQIAALTVRVVELEKE